MHTDSTLANGSTNLIFGNSRRIREILLHQCIIELCNGFEHFVAPLLCLCEEISRNIIHLILSTHGLVVPKDSLHLDKIHYALESLLISDRNLDRARGCTEYLLNLANHIEEVGPRTVHLVHVAQTRHIVFVSLTPNGFRLRLNTTYSTESHHGTIQNTKRTLHLYGKVHVPRGVYQVDFVLIALVRPISGSCCRSDSDTTLLLLNHPVHSSSTIVHLTDFVCQTGVVQDTLGGSCLTGIDVRHDTDVSV